MAGENFLSGINSNLSLGEEIDKSMISQAGIPGYEEDIIQRTKAQYQPKEIGKQSPSDLYPGAGHQIQKGTYSGSIVGSNPIYASGGNILALNPILERRKANQEAAMERAKNLKPYTAPDAPQLKAPQYQQKLENKYASEATSYIDKEYSRLGKQNADILFNDPSSEQYKYMHTLERGYQNTVKNFDQLTDMATSISEDRRNNSKLFPPEAHAMADDFERMTGPVFGEEGGFKNLDVYNTMIDKLKGYQTVSDYFKNSVNFADIDGLITSKFNRGASGEFISKSTSKITDFTGVKKELRKIAIDGLQAQINAGLVTEDQIDQHLDSRLQNKQEISGTSYTERNKDNTDKSSVGEPVVSDPKNPQKPKFSTFNRDGTIVPNGEVSYTELGYVPVSGFKVANIDQAMIINGNDMSYKLNDVLEFTLTGMATIENDKKGDQRKVGYGRGKMNVDYYTANIDGKEVSLSKNQYDAIEDEKTKKAYSKKQKKEEVDVAVVLDEAAVGSIKAANKNANIDNGVSFLESKKTKGKATTEKSKSDKPVIQFDAEGNIIE
tara:strand:- start:17877 stop:19529 length:1653 start_codon:yes stop_codon:yes gene_type:complete